MTAHLDVGRAWRDVTTQPFTPEPDARGRKRHRSLTRCDNMAVKCGTSGESSTLRGRPRRRSTSPFGTSSRNASRGGGGGGGSGSARGSVEGASASPARKRLLRVVVLDRRRSQSPSRSRSPNSLKQQQHAARRRKRTRSRSRSHEGKSYRSGEQGGWLRQDVLRKQAQKPGHGHGG